MCLRQQWAAAADVCPPVRPSSKAVTLGVQEGAWGRHFFAAALSVKSVRDLGGDQGRQTVNGCITLGDKEQD